MTYRLYEQQKYYLVLIKKDLTKEELTAYGEIDRKIHDNYSDQNPNESGFVIVKGLK